MTREHNENNGVKITSDWKVDDSPEAAKRFRALAELVTGGNVEEPTDATIKVVIRTGRAMTYRLERDPAVIQAGLEDVVTMMVRDDLQLVEAVENFRPDPNLAMPELGGWEHPIDPTVTGLAVVTCPAGTDWNIVESEHGECVAEKHRVWHEGGPADPCDPHRNRDR